MPTVLATASDTTAVRVETIFNIIDQAFFGLAGGVRAWESLANTQLFFWLLSRLIKATRFLMVLCELENRGISNPGFFQPRKKFGFGHIGYFC